MIDKIFFYLLLTTVVSLTYSCNIVNQSDSKITQEGYTSRDMIIESDTINYEKYPQPEKIFFYDADSSTFISFRKSFYKFYNDLKNKNYRSVDLFISDTVRVRGESDLDSTYIYSKEMFPKIFEHYIETNMKNTKSAEPAFFVFNNKFCNVFSETSVRYSDFIFSKDKHGLWKVDFIYSSYGDMNNPAAPSK